jgi:hypothetical protein
MADARAVIGRQMFMFDIADVFHYTPETVCYHTRTEQDAITAMFFGPSTECAPAGEGMHGMRVDAGDEACDDAGDGGACNDGQAGNPARTDLHPPRPGVDDQR